MKILSRLGIVCVDIYRVGLSTLKPPSCRFRPTCSEYAREALQKHSFFYALLLISKRLLRCHPWGGSGYDPVPEPKKQRKNER